MSRVVECLAFGFRGDKLDELRVTVELALGITMESRDGDSRGGLYFFHCGSFDVIGERLVLQRNFIADEQDFAERQFPDFGALLYVEGTVRGAQIAAALAPFARLLRSETFTI